MVNVIFTDKFQKTFSKIKDNTLKERILQQILKIKENPEVGKPMMYGRKGTRELYISPFRLSYSFETKENIVYILDLYHKDKQ